MKNRFILLLILGFGLYLIVSFSRDLWYLRQKENEIVKSQLKLETLEMKNEELKKQLEYAKSRTFLEKEAREKLGMAREGETVLILPENLKEVAKLNQKQENREQLSNWQKWWRLFF